MTCNPNNPSMMLPAGVTLRVISASGSYEGHRRGVVDLFELLASQPGLLHGAIVTDRAVGTAAAAIMARGGIARLLTPRITTAARTILAAHGVSIEASEEVDHILNRTQTGLCPLEQRTIGLTDVDLILQQVKQFIEQQ